MAWRWGPGPVFGLEMRTAARRWQTYATRAGFVAALFAAFCVVWQAEVGQRKYVSVFQMARAAEQFYYALVGTQLALLLLAAPAATAGAVSQDRSRGGLLALFVTDLSDTEIVQGKLLARLLPVLAVMACGMPVPGIAMLLGGISPEALISAYLVTAGTVVLGCTIALTLSVWASRPAEALLGTYLVLALFFLPFLAWKAVGPWFGVTSAPAWLVKTNPFWLAFAPYLLPGTTSLADAEWFLGVTLAMSAALVAFTVGRVRAACVAAAGRPDPPRHPPKVAGFRVSGPSLDLNPVLWREWHRRQSSRWSRRVWWLYGLLAAGFSVLAVALRQEKFASWVNGLQVSVGLLLFSVSAVTSLAEERARGSLDLLLTTPLTTPQILWGKWWGAFRLVPLLTLLPLLVLAAKPPGDDLPVQFILMVALILAYGAAVTSLGLASATLVPQLGRAAALSVGVCLAATVGWVVVVTLLFPDPDFQILGLGSPFFGPGELTYWDVQSRGRADEVIGGAVAWTTVYILVSGALMALTILSFNSSLGRMTQYEDPQSVA